MNHHVKPNSREEINREDTSGAQHVAEKVADVLAVTPFSHGAALETLAELATKIIARENARIKKCRRRRATHLKKVGLDVFLTLSSKRLAIAAADDYRLCTVGKPHLSCISDPAGAVRAFALTWAPPSWGSLICAFIDAQGFSADFKQTPIRLYLNAGDAA
jgi:hypothetical protein